MAENVSSQTQQNVGNFKKAAEEQVARMGLMLDEAAKLEARLVDYGISAIDEAASMWKGSMRYATELTTEWRKLSLEAARRTTELLTRP